MKSILAAFDRLRFSEGSKNYALHIARQCNAYLAGLTELSFPPFIAHK